MNAIRNVRFAAVLFASFGALAILTACSFSASTAHISDLKIGTAEDVSTPASTFGKMDTIYAIAHVANAPFKTQLTWHLIAENVVGQAPNTTIVQFDRSFDLNSD
ncbi:MAG TPA: hypothetical protein VK760_09165, partial [Candidatus Acidoferrales bacterium]|nr:hypothetical protein [Candidatus Acidoferrales bacterium]